MLNKSNLHSYQLRAIEHIKDAISARKNAEEKYNFHVNHGENPTSKEVFHVEQK